MYWSIIPLQRIRIELEEHAIVRGDVLLGAVWDRMPGSFGSWSHQARCIAYFGLSLHPCGKRPVECGKADRCSADAA
jgi:hypothetical protein